MTDWTVTDQEPAPKVGKASDFHALMDKTFGAGKWHETSGFRTPAEEDALRAQGAGTVPKGKLSHHSLGTEDQPGARDIVVDGLNPRQVARKLSATGADFVHFFPEAQKAKQGAHLHVDFNPGDPSKVDDQWQVAKTEPVKAAPKPVPKKPQPKGMMAQLGDAFADIPSEVAKTTGEAFNQVKQDLNPKKTDWLDMFGRLGMGGASPKLVGDIANYAFAPAMGAIKSITGRPVEMTTGGRVSRDTVANAASLALPVAGELKAARDAGKLAEEAGVSANTARNILSRRAATPVSKPVTPVSADATDHASRVARLKADGVYVTPWAAKGGNAKRIGDNLTSEPHVGQAVMEEQQHSIESMNRATYNKALHPIGEHYGPNMPVGRDGVAHVGQMLGKAYDQILPSVSVKADATGIADIRALMSRAKTLGEAGERQFNSIINQELLRHFDGGKAMDGVQFKAAESELSRMSRSLKGSQDHNQRELGYLLDDTTEALRDAAERSSPPGIRQRLKAINSGYAVFTRIQDASARRITAPHEGEFGVFTPTDLMAAVKKGDRTVRKGAFARGDALLQGFAEDAASVLPNKMPDPGTAGRLKQGRAGGVIGAAIGGVPGAIMGYGADVASQSVTNHLARHLLNRARTGSPRNYLKSSQGRLTAQTYGGAGGVAGAANREGGNGQ